MKFSTNQLIRNFCPICNWYYNIIYTIKYKIGLVGMLTRKRTQRLLLGLHWWEPRFCFCKRVLSWIGAGWWYPSNIGLRCSCRSRTISYLRAHWPNLLFFFFLVNRKAILFGIEWYNLNRFWLESSFGKIAPLVPVICHNYFLLPMV